MGGPQAALLLILVVHFVGGIVLIWGIVSGQDEKPDWRGWWRGDDGDEPPGPETPHRGDPLPLRDAETAPARMREPGRLADRYGRPERRPAREPQRQPTRT